MNKTSFRDVEQLSAYLDGQLSQAEKARLETRLNADAVLGDLLNDLRQARQILRKTPMRPIPRNFTLTPRMAGLRPPVPRLVPALSWASAIASLFFVLTLGSRLLGSFSFGAASPMLASAPMNSQGTGLGAAPLATEAPTTDNALTTPTPQTFTQEASQPTPFPGERAVAPPSPAKSTSNPISPWLFIWPGLAILLLGIAILLRQSTLRKFHNKFKK